MAISKVLDITTDVNDNDIFTQDIGGWDSAILQLVSPTGTFSFLSSNDSGGITGVSDGSSVSATNFTTIVGTKLSDGTLVSSLAASGMVRFSSIGQYLQITGAGGAQVTKAFLRLYKIN